MNKTAEDVAMCCSEPPVKADLLPQLLGVLWAGSLRVSTESASTRSRLSQGGCHPMTDRSQRMKTWPSQPTSGHL